MDFSGYDKSHPCYDNTNEKRCQVNLKMNMTENSYTTHWIKTDMYCCETDDQYVVRKVKAFVKHIKKLTIGDFLYTLTDKKRSHYTFNNICPKNHHQVFSISQHKVGLSSYDDKKKYYTDNNLIAIWSSFNRLRPVSIIRISDIRKQGLDLKHILILYVLTLCVLRLLRAGLDLKIQNS